MNTSQADNTTHHAVTTNGVTRCAYCRAINPDTQQACPKAPR